ncbi:hypothetical protein F5ESL0236_07560 [Lactobacillus sp. ESL0236]|uniref:hypothetical protein n=1 Tax=unclassified Lactobacillus TaxID=2620435 RepID=UPI000EFC3B05|nr:MULTISPECIES: hypothetical protein [unclassified Lactobacillus]RMC36001.1 hypothetical protein F5ESL0237_08135 [Lactobacillus sp. ESL0237]RMC42499.1 hypothetical protein F5ESL0234_07980 [Lactobacillus sp. ESL0234]RMC43492.1 hypothetical protein F5ESL0236_07560 [Lactobacillus sp. ESL0236]
MEVTNDWQSKFEKRASNTKAWGGILVIAVIAYFIWQSKIALFATLCSAFFFIENIVVAYYSYRKKETEND